MIAERFILALAIVAIAAATALSGCLPAPSITERSDFAPLTSPRPMPRPEITP